MKVAKVMKALGLTVCAGLLALTVYGCSSESTDADASEQNISYADFEFLQEAYDGFILEDTTTNVLYYVYQPTSYQCAITPLFLANGSLKRRYLWW